MFKNLEETIKTLNADVNNVANCEKAKKLRKKLLSIGLSMAICGFLGVFTCFVLFATAGFGVGGKGPDIARVLVPCFLFIPCGVVGGIGSSIASLGFHIVVTGYTTNMINESIANNCPNCGAILNSEKIFCSKCGTKVRKECSKCKHINDLKSEFCEKCGTKLG